MSAARYSMQEVAPEVYAAMAALQRAVNRSALPRPLLELVKLHASQLNHCAFCLDMHSKDAVALGILPEKLFMLAAWREAPCYEERERAALAWTETLTLIAERGVPDELYRSVRAQFTEQELSELTLAVVAINGWNRLAISTGMEAGHYSASVHTASMA